MKLSGIQKEFQMLKMFINKYNWEGINYQSKLDDWKRFQKNNPTITHNILYTKKKEIIPAYISKHNSTHDKQKIVLMIPNEEKKGWHYLAVKILSVLFHKKNFKT